LWAVESGHNFVKKIVLDQGASAQRELIQDLEAKKMYPSAKGLMGDESSGQ